MKSKLIIKPTWFDFSFNNYHAHCYTRNSVMTTLRGFQFRRGPVFIKGCFLEGSNQLKNTTIAAFTHSACVPEFNPHNLFTFTKFDFVDLRLICQITDSYYKLNFNSVIKVCFYMPKITNI